MTLKRSVCQLVRLMLHSMTVIHIVLPACSLLVQDVSGHDNIQRAQLTPKCLHTLVPNTVPTDANGNTNGHSNGYSEDSYAADGKAASTAVGPKLQRERQALAAAALSVVGCFEGVHCGAAAEEPWLMPALCELAFALPQVQVVLLLLYIMASLYY
jgi:hypothetical protein